MVGGVEEGKGRGSGEEYWGQRGENNGVTKAALFCSCGRGKTGYRKAKLSGARYFNVSGKFESFWRLNLYSALVRATMI